MRNQVDDLGLVGITIQDWDERLAFPFKTLTTDYRTWITYISRKPVPANTPITDLRYWKPIARLNKDLVIDYQNFKDAVNSKVQALANYICGIQQQLDDMNTKMESFFATASGGKAFSNMYGDSQVIGVTQKTLTETISKLYTLIGDTIGIDMNNVEITITPDSFFKNEAAVVNISAIAMYGLLDSVKVYFDGEKVLERTTVQAFSENLTVSKTTTIKVKVVLFGRSYIEEKTVQMSSDFFIGAGASHEDIYNPTYSRTYDGNPTGSYQVQVEEGQRIIIILPTADVSKIEQIEMNDFNIPMDTTTFGIYTAYTSLNTYKAGTYTIDINY